MNQPLTKLEHAFRLSQKLNRQMSMASNAVWAMQSTVEEIESRFGSGFSNEIQKRLNECFTALEAMQEFNSTKKIIGI